MKIEQTNLLLEAAAPAPEAKPIAVWGLALLAIVLAALALAVVWVKGDLVRIQGIEEKKTASLWILGVLVAIFMLHICASEAGAYRAMGLLFRRQDRSASTEGDPAKPSKYDPRLADLRAELQAQFGWRWKYRQPWLLVTGEDALTESVAPGLRQTGFVLTEHAVLLHASPENVDAKTWREQISRMRWRRPSDAVAHVMRTTDASRPDTELARTLATQAIELKWAAPVYLLHSVEVGGGRPDTYEAVGLTQNDPSTFSSDLYTIMRGSSHRGTLALFEPRRIPYMAQLSQYMDHQSSRITAQFDALVASKWRRASLAGMVFAPAYPSSSVVDPDQPAMLPASVLPTWQFLAAAASAQRGKRIGFQWPNAIAAMAAVATMAWCVALVISFIGNQSIVRSADTAAKQALAASPGSSGAIRTQLQLQQTIEMLEERREHGAPWYLRAGLNSNDAVLATLWRPYRTVSARNLQEPVAQSLQSTLVTLAQLRSDSPQGPEAMQRYYNALKAYLMLAEPKRDDPAFLTQQLVATWRAPPDMPPGEWLDKSPRLAGFYANQLPAHPEWRIAIDDVSLDPTIGGARNALVNQIGLQNAEDALYKSLIDEARGKYSDATLTTVLNGADARGLFATAQSVPGIYTRAAWDGVVAESIDKISHERKTGGDWVLTATSGKKNATQDTDDDSQENIKQRLIKRYFADYAAAWQGFLNSVQWQPSNNLSGAIDQLTRLADAQQSPLIALMKSVQFQAQAGRQSQALSDTLVRKAQDLLHGGDASSQIQSPPVNPLDLSFGPLLALMGDNADNRSARKQR